MIGWLDSSIQSRIISTAYRYRFLVVYVVFGFFSLWIEIIALRGLGELGAGPVLAHTAGILAGILTAFWLNVRFNFKVPRAKRRKALMWFAGISIFSGCLQYFCRGVFLPESWSYEQGRFAVSSFVFLVAYGLHRRFSFADRKQVGVAVYANSLEDLRSVHSKVGDFPDFIHVDLIDSSFASEDVEVRAYRMETIRALWPKKDIHVHLMTRHPSRGLPQVISFADVVVIHAEIEDPVGKIIQDVRQGGCKVGLALCLESPLSLLQAWATKVDLLLLLCIEHHGRSGQVFQLKGLDRLAEVNLWPERRNTILCADGGITESNIRMINVEKVVSGSSVLKAKDPVRQIMRLQTCNNYESV